MANQKETAASDLLAKLLQSDRISTPGYVRDAIKFQCPRCIRRIRKGGNYTRMKCPKCQADLNEENVEGRKRQTCPKCSYMHYEGRKTTGGYQMILDDIADEVARTGTSKYLAVGLLNTCFREEPGRNSFQEQLSEWCVEHGFNFSPFQGKDAHGKSAQWLRFSRQAKR